MPTFCRLIFLINNCLIRNKQKKETKQEKFYYLKFGITQKKYLHLAKNSAMEKTKIKFQLEYLIQKPSISLLWNAVSTASGLEDWFADGVSINGKRYTFRWADYEQTAELVAFRHNILVRFHWEEDCEEKYFFEIKFTPDELTGDVALILTDFASEEDIEDTKNLWNKQIRDMLRKTGVVTVE